MSDFPTSPPPVLLFFELTSVCNMRCRHCYIRGGEGPRREIPGEVITQLMEEFQALGGQMVSFSGGEPTLHHSWRDAVKYARYLGLEATLLTNGSRLKDRDIEFLARFGCNVAVSLDGSCAATHDSLRGEGAFDKACQLLSRLAAFGLGPTTTIMFTPMAFNFMELPGLVALAEGLGVGTVYVSLLEDRGRAEENLGDLSFQGPNLLSLIYSILSLQDRFPQVQIQCTNLKLFPERLRGLELETDPLDRTIRVTADADLFLTAYLDGEDFFLGRFAPGSLHERWQSRKTRLAFAQAERFKARGEEECTTCMAWPWCKGGSAAFAWSRSGTFSGTDGFCDAKRRIVGDLLGVEA